MLFRTSKNTNTKPPMGAQINWGHPLAKDLVVYFVFNEGGGIARSLVIPYVPSTTSHSWKVGGIGLSGSFNGTTDGIKATDFPSTYTGRYSIASRVVPTTVSAG